VLIAAPLAVWAHRVHASAAERADKIAHDVPQQDRAGYATSAACEACHPSQYDSWRRGYHHTMTQYATPREHLNATSEAVATAEDAYVRRALDSVEWERRGLLGRLSRRR